MAEHLPNRLIALNTVKKDTRTIDEITRDLEHRRTGTPTNAGKPAELTGPDATGFTDWFGKTKREREKDAKEREEDRKRMEVERQAKQQAQQAADRNAKAAEELRRNRYSFPKAGL